MPAPSFRHCGKQCVRSTRGPVAARSTRRGGQLVDLDELGTFDALYDELGYSLAAVQRDRAGSVVVDDDHLDLAAISGVDGARCVHQTEPDLDRKPRSGM